MAEEEKDEVLDKKAAKAQEKAARAEADVYKRQTISFCGWRARWRIWTAAVGFATGIWRRQSATEALTESSGRGEEMNYAYWFANIPGLSNCAKISIHEKVGNAQDIYFLSEKQMENMQLLAKEIQAVRAAQKTDMEEAYAKMCESGIRCV